MIYFDNEDEVSKQIYKLPRHERTIIVDLVKNIIESYSRGSTQLNSRIFRNFTRFIKSTKHKYGEFIYIDISTPLCFKKHALCIVINNFIFQLDRGKTMEVSIFVHNMVSLVFEFDMFGTRRFLGIFSSSPHSNSDDEDSIILNKIFSNKITAKRFWLKVSDDRKRISPSNRMFITVPDIISKKPKEVWRDEESLLDLLETDLREDEDWTV